MATKETKSVFETLNAIDCSRHIEKKNGLSYLSWAWAWTKVKEHYPTATFTIYKDENGRPYHTDGRTCWVETGVTIEGIEHIEYLPIMDFRNASIPLEIVTSMDMNKAIQRSLTKAAARHGLGLYIYAGEDLPEAAIEDGVSGAIAEIQAATSTDELKDIYAKYTPTMNASPQAKNDITAALTKRKTELLSPSVA